LLYNCCHSFYIFHIQFCLLIWIVVYYEKLIYDQLKRGTQTTSESFCTILQVENIQNKEAMLEAAHALRLEREREKSLANQKHEQQASLNQTEQRLQRLQQQLKEMRQAAVGATPAGY
jgi:hypothetical protein